MRLATHLIAPTERIVSVRFDDPALENTASSPRGLAYRPAPGAQVKSPAAAVVAYAGPLNGWGQVVILRA